jgi:hypothetical protein
MAPHSGHMAQPPGNPIYSAASVPPLPPARAVPKPWSPPAWPTVQRTPDRSQSPGWPVAPLNTLRRQVQESRTIQRLPLPTLTTTEAAQKHHPNYTIPVPGSNDGSTTTVHLDDWAFKKRTVDQKVKKRVRIVMLDAIRNWDCSGSIVDRLISVIAQIQDTSPDAPFYQRVVDHWGGYLVAAQENIQRRENDIPKNCIDVRLTTEDIKKNLTSTVVKIGWVTLLKEGRERLKAELLRGTSCPAKDQVKLLKAAVPTTNDPVTRDLYTKGFLDDEMSLKTKKVYKPPLPRGSKITALMEAPKYNDEGKINSFNFGYGHISYTLFLEWRMCADLTIKQQV